MRPRRTRRPRDEAERRAFIESYRYPPGLREKIDQEYDPALGEERLDTVLEGLRAWLLACLYGGGKTLGMPSQAVDVAWHEFILFTREYHEFCERAFGYYLHHTPEAALEEPPARSFRRTVAVVDRHQAHLAIAQMPFLFAVDSTLGLDEGIVWSLEEIEVLRSGGAVVGDPASGFFLAGGDGGAASCGGGSCGGGSCGGGGGG